MSTIAGIVHSIAPPIAIALLITSMFYAVRWAKKGGSRAAALGSALLLFFGFGVVADPPQQRIEEAREDKGKMGGESGDPPSPS